MIQERILMALKSIFKIATIEHIYTMNNKHVKTIICLMFSTTTQIICGRTFIFTINRLSNWWTSAISWCLNIKECKMNNIITVASSKKFGNNLDSKTSSLSHHNLYQLLRETIISHRRAKREWETPIMYHNPWLPNNELRFI